MTKIPEDIKKKARALLEKVEASTTYAIADDPPDIVEEALLTTHEEGYMRGVTDAAKIAHQKQWLKCDHCGITLHDWNCANPEAMKKWLTENEGDYRFFERRVCSPTDDVNIPELIVDAILSLIERKAK